MPRASDHGRAPRSRALLLDARAPPVYVVHIVSPARRSAICLLVIGWAATCVACLPIPHMEQDAPALRGVARQNGEPLRGVVVKRAIDPAKAKQLACGAKELTKT